MIELIVELSISASDKQKLAPNYDPTEYIAKLLRAAGVNQESIRFERDTDAMRASTVFYGMGILASVDSIT